MDGTFAYRFENIMCALNIVSFRNKAIFPLTTTHQPHLCFLCVCVCLCVVVKVHADGTEELAIPWPIETMN